MNIGLVRLNDVGLVEFFNIKNHLIESDELVIVEIDKSLFYGRLVKIINSNKISEKYIKGSIIRVANKNDIRKIYENIRYQKDALIKCREIVANMEMKMNIIDCIYTFDRDQMIFKFLADERIDFRQLAKELGSIFKTRIELRQIGIRDKAKEIGGIGPCGRKLCCNNFLREFSSVSINMAKNQNVSLNPCKINGVCGRLKCCLNFENDNYKIYKKGLPDIYSKIKTESGDGRVISVDVFNKKYRVLLDTMEIIEVSIDDDSKK